MNIAVNSSKYCCPIAMNIAVYSSPAHAVETIAVSFFAYIGTHITAYSVSVVQRNVSILRWIKHYSSL